MRTSRTALIAALLAGVLAMTGVLAWHAWTSARERRAIAQAALRDYAAFGASEFGRRARETISNASVFGALRAALSVNAAVPAGRLPPVTILRPATVAAVDLRPGIATWFRIVLATGDFSADGEPLDALVMDWLRDSVPTHARRLQAENRYFGLLVRAGPRPLAAGFISRYGADGRVAVTYGYVLPAESLALVFRSVLAGPALLPRTTAPVPNDSALAVVIASPAGAEIFRAGVVASDAVAESLGTQFGGLVARVSTRPDAASRFVIGGVPRLPVLPLAGGFVLAAALIAVAFLQLRREAELSRLREDFVAGVSHELRTPLAQIRLFAETLLLGRVRSDEEQQRALTIVHSEARRLSHLVENLLQFSRAGRAAGALPVEALSLDAELRGVVDGFVPLAAERRVTVSLDVDASVIVRADRGALRQVLLNLLDNALKHGPDGQSVRVHAVEVGRVARIVVEDQGKGIALEDRARVFERFARLDGARGTTGVGLGLAVVRELVRRMNGRVWAEDAPRGGARLVVELPGGSG